jgi:small subunit ribosomal protein S5
MSNFVIDQSDIIQKSDGLLEKLILVKRNSKVSKGGRVFGFSALTVVGDKNGRFGVGRGKAKEVPFAIQKAMENARRNLVYVKLDGDTIYHAVKAKFCSTQVLMLPASKGTGIISSFVIRSIFEAVGIKNVFAKCFGSKNPNNIARCAIKCLLSISNSVEASSIRQSLLDKNRL